MAWLLGTRRLIIVFAIQGQGRLLKCQKGLEFSNLGRVLLSGERTMVWVKLEAPFSSTWEGFPFLWLSVRYLLIQPEVLLYHASQCTTSSFFVWRLGLRMAKRYFVDHELFSMALRPSVPGFSLWHQVWICFLFLKTSAVVCPCCQRSSRHAPLFGIQWPHLASSGLNDLSLGALGHWLDFYLPTLQALPVLGVAVGQGIIFPLAWKHTDPDEQRLVRENSNTGKAETDHSGPRSKDSSRGNLESLGRTVSVIVPKKTAAELFLVSWSKALSKESLDS